MDDAFVQIQTEATTHKLGDEELLACEVPVKSASGFGQSLRLASDLAGFSETDSGHIYSDHTGSNDSKEPAVEFGKLRLKRLSIQGFKSFAQPCQILLNEGMTAIVGPNGCGKSNIVDAIRWVLGEPNARALRADGMQDVLFAGAQDQPATSLAQVTLELEGSWVDRPLIYDALEVTRRLFRTGESEYRVNQKPSRLKDIHQLFADTGVGRHAFAIFEQGKIEQMVSMSHAQRRLILEEAAGISGYKAMKREALVKWEQIDERIRQLQSTYSELLERRERLERQAQHAMEYRRCQEQIEHLEKAQLLQLWHEIDDQLRTLSIDSRQLQTRLAALVIDDQQLSTQMRENEIALNESNYQLTPLQKRVVDDQQRYLLLVEQRRSLKEQSEIYRRQERELSGDRDQTQSKLGQQEEVLKRAKKAYAEGQIATDQLHLLIESSSKSQQQSYLAMQSHREQMRTLEASLRESLHRLALLEQSLQGTHRQLELIREQHSRERLQLSRDSMQLEQAQGDLRKWSSSEVEQADLLRGYQQQLAQLQEQLDPLVVSQGEMESRERALLLDLERKKMAWEWTSRACQDRSSLSQALLWLEKLPSTDAIKQKVRPLHGVLKQIPLERREHFRFLDEAVLVATLEEAKEFIRRLRAAKITQFSILAIEAILPHCVGLWPHVESPLIERLLLQMPLESDSLPFTDPASILSSSSQEGLYQRWLYLDDSWVRMDSAGVLWPQTKSESRFELLARLPEQENEYKRACSDHLDCSGQLKELQLLRRKLHHRREDLDSSIKKQQIWLDECQRKKAQFQDTIGRLEPLLKERELRLKPMLEREEASDRQAKEQAHELKELKATHEVQSNAFKPMQKRQQELDATHRHLEQQLKESERRREEQIRRSLQEQTHEQVAAQRIQELKELDKQLLNRLELQGKQLQENLEATRHLDQEIPEREGVWQGSRALLEQLQGELQLLKSHCEVQRSRLQQQTEEKGKLQLQLQEVESKREKLLWQRSRYEADMEERYAVAIDLMHLDEVMKPSERASKLKQLKKQLESYGEVNFAAIREMEEVGSRQSLLEVQIKDIQNSQVEVMRILSNLDEKCKKKFSETFERVGHAFSRNFELLFEGGHASLQYCNAQDEEGSGVQIFVCPPGKQLKSMTLMSGGEKCLTSMAFMMALFEVRPAPFCLLDEIDAPLDDANVDRFLNLLRHYSQKTQIFIITHNKKTMAAAQTLIGVSMPKRGVSRILTLDLASKRVN